ncbi:SDR family oxidoreductase [bacterium SCSIO 12696]|nr:SDR family oxidoreductase [bacterium SCSIO 12696]
MAITKQVALVTGGSRGIGAAVARNLASKGYSVCINFKSQRAHAEKLRNELMDDGFNAITVQADVSIEDDVVRLFNAVDNQLGPVTALVNNAGILLPQMRVEDMDAQRINHVITTNITSQFICAREAIKRIAFKYGGRGGAIVNVSSGAARLGSPNEYVDYAASKGAVDTFTKGLALEMAEQGVRVNGVRPGSTYTDMHADGGEPGRVERVKHKIPLKRGAQVDEIANAIGWLLSEEASYVTGTILDVTGGL